MPVPRSPVSERDDLVVIRDEDIDIERIQDAIRARVAQRAAAIRPIADDDVAGTCADRVRSLDDWDFPRDIWDAMWPPRLEPWNHDEDHSLASHRRGLGSLVVSAKRAVRAALRLVLRPVLHQQMRINRTLALMTRTLADELARERLRTSSLEQRVSRVTAVAREARGDRSPLVVFADEPEVDE